MPGIGSVRGTHDILPAEMPAWKWLYGTHQEVAEQFGYQRIETPIFEFTEMFERGIGAGTDVVEKEMYTFVDKGGKSLTLRPESTPATVRAVLGAHLEQEMRPVRVQYSGSMFRHENPQKGRLREFHQLGIEALAERSAALDAEIIEIGWRFFERLGITGLSLQVNTLGDLDDRTRYRAALVDYYTPLESQLCDDCKRRLTMNPLRLLDCKRDAQFLADAPLLDAVISDESREFFDQVVHFVSSAGIPFTLNPRLVRGLDYYAHTTFEWWHTSLRGAQNALGGGGRYDGLAQVLGFPETPGTGYALGCERILLVAEAIGVKPAAATSCDVVVCSVAVEQALAASETARELREGGLRVVFDGSKRKLDRKLRDADRQGARWVVIIGEREVTDKTVSLRDVAAGSAQTVARDSVRRTLKEQSRD